MKKLFNRLSSSGKIDASSLKEEQYSDEEHLDTHYRKPTTLPAEPRDTSQDLKLKKSFSGSGSIGKGDHPSAFSVKKSSSVKLSKDKEIKDKDKLNESTDKSLKKSGSTKKRSIGKSSDLLKKDTERLRSPSLKSIFVSDYKQQRDLGSVESSDSEEEGVPRSRGNSLHDDDFYTNAPIRVPSAPGRLASSPVPMLATPPNAAARAVSPRMDSLTPSPVPMYATPPKSAMRAQSPRVEMSSSGMAYSPPESPHARAYSPPTSPHARAYSPPTSPHERAYSPPTSPHERAYSPPTSPHERAYSPPTSPHAYTYPVPIIPRSPSAQQASTQSDVLDADEFDLRFAVRERQESISDDTALGADFERGRWDSISEDVDMVDEAEITNQKSKSGLFSFGKNTPKKLK